MSSIMLGDMSASSMGMPLADFVYLQRRGEDRVVRYRNRRRPRGATPGDART